MIPDLKTATILLMDSENKKICILPWTHLSTYPLGTIKPCCIAKEYIPNGKKFFNIKEDNLNDVLKSPYMKMIRDEFRNGRFPKTCLTCEINERNDVFSKREQHLQWQKERNIPDVDYNKEPESISDLQIILSNKCNLKCRTCNAIYSTKWTQESLERNMIRYNQHLPNMDYRLSQKVFKTLPLLSSSLHHIEYMGGEPFIQPEFYQFTDKLIESGESKNIHLSFSSNGIFNGDVALSKLCKNFLKVSLNLSIDGVNSQFNYLRHGGSWIEAEHNLKKYMALENEAYTNFSCVVTHTVSWLNVYYVPELFESLISIAPSVKIFINLVFEPDYLNSSILPTDVKEKILKKLFLYLKKRPQFQSEFKTLTQHLELAHPHRLLFEEGILINQDGDKYRKESYSQTFPEFYNLIEKYYTKAKTRRWSTKVINNFLNGKGKFDFIYD